MRHCIVVFGDGFKEWMVDVPTQDGATAADLLKELENAVSLELRSHDLLKETLVVPKTALWREISMHLTHGYYLFAHVGPVPFYYKINGKVKKKVVKPCMTIQEFILKHCPKQTVVDKEKTRVIPSVTIDLVQRLEFGVEPNPVCFKVVQLTNNSAIKKRSWARRSWDLAKSFRSLSLAKVKADSDDDEEGSAF